MSTFESHSSAHRLSVQPVGTRRTPPRADRCPGASVRDSLREQPPQSPKSRLVVFASPAAPMSWLNSRRRRVLMGIERHHGVRQDRNPLSLGRVRGANTVGQKATDPQGVVSDRLATKRHDFRRLSSNRRPLWTETDRIESRAAAHQRHRTHLRWRSRRLAKRLARCRSHMAIAAAVPHGASPL